MISRAHFCLTVGAITAFALSCGELSAQDVWVRGVHASSSQDSFERSGGFGLGAAIPASERFDVQIALKWTASESDRHGLACSSYNPRPLDCEEDRLSERVRVRSFRISAHGAADLLEYLHADLGLGVSSNELTGASRPVSSSRIGNLYVPPTAHMGVFLQTGVAWSPVDELPLKLVLDAAGHWIFFDGCRTTGSWHAPFCGGSLITELSVGASYRVFR